MIFFTAYRMIGTVRLNLFCITSLLITYKMHSSCLSWDESIRLNRILHPLMQSTRVWSRCRMHLEELRGKHITCLKMIYLTLGHCSLWVLCELCGSWFCRVVHISTLFIAMLSYMGCWTYWLLFRAICMGHEKAEAQPANSRSNMHLSLFAPSFPQVWPSFNIRTYPPYDFSASFIIRTRIFFDRVVLHKMFAT